MKILFVLPYVFATHTPISQVELPFVRTLLTSGSDVFIICSDRYVGNSEYGNKVLYVHENRFVVFVYKVLERIHLHQWLLLPDYTRFSWNRRALREATRLIKKEKIDIVHTASYPSSSHLLGLKIKEKMGVKWVARFYDPWCDNPHLPVNIKFIKRINDNMERSVAEKADVILHTNYKMCLLWKRKYNEILESKIQVLPIVANPINNVPTLRNPDTNKSTIVISHIGNLYKNRSAEPLIRAVSHIRPFLESYKYSLSVIFVGNVYAGDKDLIHQSNLDTIFSFTGQLSEEDCAEYYNKSDVLIAIDGNFAESVFFPSKIVKYFYSQKPILGITTQESVLEMELRDSGHRFFRREDISGLSDFISTLLSKGTSSLLYDKQYYMKYEDKEVLKKYDSIVRNIH